MQPSTGMDPEARRNMWTVIEQVSAQRSVVLVTHSMEEVEALCTRMGVMVSGRLQCIGSAQHLKGRFGLGYQVEIRSIPARVQECIALCERVMVQVVVEEVHGGYVRLKVNKEVDLAGAFSALEEHKAALSILDYSISQCTLEQVFLKFAKDQEEETGQVAGLNTIGAALNSNDGGQSSDGLGDVQKIQHGSETGEVLAQPGQVRVAYSASSAEPSSVNKLGDDVLVFRADCAGAEGPIPHDLLEEPERKEDDFTK